MSSVRPCKVCNIADPELRAKVENALAAVGSLGVPQAIIEAGAEGVTLSKYQLQKHRTELHNSMGSESAPVGAGASVGRTGPALSSEARVEVKGDGSVDIIRSPETFDEEADFDGLLRNFGVDPAKVMVLRDTVRISARTVRWTDPETGEEVSKVARSYSAGFMPRPNHWLDDEYIDDLVNRMLRRGVKPIKPLPKGDSSFLVALADLQLGKSEGGGVEATLERIDNGIDSIVAHFHSLRKRGYAFEQIVLAQMGDLLEGCTGNYDSQLFTVQLNQRRQLDLGIGVMTSVIDRFRSLGLPVFVVSVNSNHGSWMRRGGRANITSTSDTSDGAVEDALKRIFRNDPEVTFTDLQDQAVVTAEISGVNLGFAHGHLTSPAKSGKWLDDQERVLVDLEGFNPDVFITAHSHHFKQTDMGSYMHFQCPALDGGSRWFQDVAGRWSTAGILTMVIGKQFPIKATEVNVAWATPLKDVYAERDGLPRRGRQPSKQQRSAWSASQAAALSEAA